MANGHFKAKIQKGFRIVIPEAERTTTGLKEGQIVEIEYRILTEPKKVSK